MDKIVLALLEQETLTAEQIENIVEGRAYNEFPVVKTEEPLV